MTIAEDQSVVTPDDMIRATVQALIAGNGTKAEIVAASIGMTPATMYRRLGGVGSSQAFHAGEVAALARHFGVEVEDLFTGLGGRLHPSPKAAQTVTRQYLSANTRDNQDATVLAFRRSSRKPAA